MELSIPIKLLISLLIGFAIGLERESYERQTDKTPTSGVGSLGVRTYALITTLGTTAGLLMVDYFSTYLLVSVAFLVLVVCYYIIGSLFTKDNGLTTDIAVVWSYLIGIIIGQEIFPMDLTIAMVVCLILILSSKQTIKGFVHRIKEYEFRGFVSFAIIALVIFPFLPNRAVTLVDIPFISTLLDAYGLNSMSLMTLELFNPSGVWRVVVLITGIDIVGYVLEKTVGQKGGWILTSVVGGFISSTSTTQSLALQSKTSHNVNQLVAAAVYSNMSSFFQMFVLLATVNSLFLTQQTAFILVIIGVALATGSYFALKRSKKVDPITETKSVLERNSIFSLGPALKFAALFMVIKLSTKIALMLFGDGGFIAGNMIASLTGLDAVIINTAELVGKTVTAETGILVIAAANAVNLMSKSTYAFLQGSREFALKFFVSASCIALAGLGAAIIL